MFTSEKDQDSGTCVRDPFAPIKGYVHILVVEDEQKMAKALQEGLEADEYSVQVAHTGEEGFYLVQAQPFDLVILDVMLPGHDGFEILATLRKRGIKTPVMLLTSRDAVEDRVRGLLVAVGGVFDQLALGLLEALRDATAGLGHRQLGGVELLLSAHAADSRGFCGSRVGLFLLVSRCARFH